MKRFFAYVGASVALTHFVLYLVPSKSSSILIYVTIGLALLFAASLVVQTKRQVKAIVLCVATCFFTCFLFTANYYVNVKSVYELDSKSAYCSFYVTEENGNSYKVKVNKVYNFDKKPFNTSMYASSDMKLEPYREYIGKLEFFSNTDNPLNLYGEYADNIYINSRCSEVKYVGKSIKSIRMNINVIRSEISKRLLNVLGDNYGGLSAALLTGDKKNLSYETKNDFYNIGASHITAVSGLHLSVITGVFLFILNRLKVNKKLSAVLSAFLVILCMGVAAFSGSVTRAGIMMLVMLSALLFDMRSDGANSLGLSVALICANPYALSDLGTVFSIICVFAVIVVYPLFGSRFYVRYNDPLFKTKKEKLLDTINKLLSAFYTSLIICFVSLPVSYLFFGSTSIVSPVANLFVMPIGSACVVLSLFCCLATFTHIGFIISIVSAVTKFFDFLLVSTAEFFASFGTSKIIFDYRFGIALGGVFVLLFIGVVTQKRNSIKFTALLSALVCIVCLAAVNINDKDKAEIYVVNNGAFVMTYNGTTVVSNIKNSTDCYYVARYLKSNALIIDYLICDSDDKYYASLSEDVEVINLICNEFNDTILNSVKKKNLEVRTAYSVKLDDNVYVYCINGDVTVDINGFTFSNFDKNCLAYVGNNTVSDSKGTVNLDDGAVVYTVNDKNTFNVRRLNRWQK